MKQKDMMAYYKKLSNATRDDLKKLWREVTEEKYWYSLECLPPARYKNGAFLVGEAITHSNDGAIHDLYVKYKGKYYTRPAVRHYFDAIDYKTELKIFLGD